MKNLLFSFILIIGPLYSYSQLTADSLTRFDDSVAANFRPTMDEIFENLDLSSVTTNLLFDRGISIIDLEYFKGESLDDSVKSSLFSFGLCMASLTSMEFNENVIPHPDSYRSITDPVTPYAEVIPMVGMHYEYHAMDQNSIDNNQIYIQNDKPYDIFPRTSEPYIKKNVFSIVPAQNRIWGSTVNFVFNQDQFYGNSGKTVSQLVIDFSDGRGFLPFTFGQQISSTYADSGPKKISIKLTYTDGSEFYSNFDVFVHGLTSTRDGDNDADAAFYIPPINVSGDPSAGRVGGWVYIYYGCGHNTVLKPLIWAEAFNPSEGSLDFNLTKEHLVQRMSTVDTEDGNTGNTLFQDLMNDGYDIIILDYDNGQDYLPRTSEFIKQAIREINGIKGESNTGNSVEKNIIIGQSMGGVATNLALKEMELVSNEDHDVGTFIIFDSPIMGVNLPLCAQGSLWSIASMPIYPTGGSQVSLYDFVEKIESVTNIWLSPASRTMTAYIPHIISPQYHLWEDHYDYQHNVLGGMPEDCEIITIANGSHAGANGQHEFSPGELVVHAAANTITFVHILSDLYSSNFEDNLEDQLDDNIPLGSTVNSDAILTAWVTGINVETDIKLYAVDDDMEGTYYHHDILVWTWWDAIDGQIDNPIFNDEITLTLQANDKIVPAIDNAPGGFFASGQNGIVLDPQELGVYYPQVFKLTTYCFTPTVSVLNYHGNLTDNSFFNPLHDFTNNSQEISSGNTKNVDNYLANSTTPNFGTMISYKNTAHTWFTTESSEFARYHLTGQDLLGNTGNGTVTFSYNYGKIELSPDTDYLNGQPRMTRSYLDESLVFLIGDLGVNRATKIGRSDIPYPSGPALTAPNSSFLLNIGNTCDNDPPVELSIWNNSEFVLGDGNDRVATVNVIDGSKVIIKNGGTLRIKKGCTFNVDKGAELIVEDGGKVIIEDFGILKVKLDGLMTFEEGAEIHLNGENSQLDMQGQLHLLENAVFRPLHDNVPSGFITLREPDGWLTSEDNTRLEFIGDHEYDILVVFKQFGRMLVPSNVQYVLFSNCMVIDNEDFQPYSIQSHCPMFVSGCRFVTGPESIQAQNHPIVHAFDNLSITNSILDDFRIVCSYTNGGNLNFLNSEINYTIDKSKTQIEVLGGGYNLTNSSLKNYESKGLKSTSLMLPSNIIGTTFIGESNGSSFGVEDFSPITLKLNGNTFNNNYTHVTKTDGKLVLRCNDFNNSLFSAVSAYNNCWLEMGVFGGGGYNVINNVTFYNVYLSCAQEIQFSSGYNTFDATTGNPIIAGSVQIGPANVDKQYRHAKKNIWTGANPFPSPNDVDVWSCITGNDISLTMTDPGNAACGVYDPISSKPMGVGNLEGTKKISTLNFNNETVLDAVEYTILESEMNDELKNDLIALSLFDEILTYDINNPNKQTLWMIKYANDYMKQVMNNTFLTGRICRDDNVGCFHGGVQNYVNVLNKLSSPDVDEGNYIGQFYLELNKAHLYYLLGKTDIALQFLYNMESCGLDYNEQKVVNEWKYRWESQLVQESFGPEAFLKDTTWIDTSYYYVPTNQSPGNFGSKIVDHATIIFENCSVKSAYIGEESYEFSVFPNPTNGMINITYELPENSEGEIRVLTVDNRLIVSKPAGKGIENVDLSQCEAGVYLVQLYVNGQLINGTKVIKK